MNVPVKFGAFQTRLLRKSGFCITCYVASFVVAVAILTLSLTWWLAAQALAAARQHAERLLQQETSEISTFIDREIVNAHNILIALAGSPYFHDGNFEAFHARLSDVASQVGFYFALRDNRLNSQVLNTARPWFASLAGNIAGPPSLAGFERLRAGVIATSNLFWGPLIGQYAVKVVIPVHTSESEGKSAEAAPYALGAGIPASHFHQILRGINQREERVFTVLDRNGVIIARSHRNMDFVGKTVGSISPEYLKTRPARGIVKDRSIEGIEYCWAYVRSDLTGWTILAGVPESTLRAGAHSTAWRFALAGGGVLLLAIGGAFGVGARISRKAGALGIDRPPTLDEFNVLFESAPNGVAVVDEAGLILLVNAQVERIFDYPRHMLIGKPIELLLPKWFSDAHFSSQQIFNDASQLGQIGSGEELSGRRNGGAEIPVEGWLTPITTRSGRLFMATIVDISERRLAADKLKAVQLERDAFGLRFMQAQEDERLRLARELHDETGQLIVAAMLDLKSLEPHIGRRGETRALTLTRRLQSVSEALHHVAQALRPASIDGLGLEAALATHLEDWSVQLSISADFHCDGPLNSLSEDLSAALYRIVQEALNNVAKHAAGASSVNVILHLSDGSLRLTIADDGPGFSVDQIQTTSGARRQLGLAGIRERAILFGGELDIESSSSGTSVCVRIPVATALSQ